MSTGKLSLIRTGTVLWMVFIAKQIEARPLDFINPWTRQPLGITKTFRYSQDSMDTCPHIGNFLNSDYRACFSKYEA